MDKVEFKDLSTPLKAVVILVVVTTAWFLIGLIGFVLSLSGA